MAILALWHISSEVFGAVYIPSPADVLPRIALAAASGVLLHRALATLTLAAAGFLAGGLAAIASAVVLHGVPRLQRASEPYILASAGIPKYALMPLLVLWCGIGHAPKVWLVALLVFFPIFINTSAALANLDRRLVDAVRILGATRSAATRYVIWHSGLPYFLAALQLAVPRAISGAVIGELLVGEQGIGYEIERSRQSLDTVGVFAGIITATLLVLIASASVSTLMNRHHGERTGRVEI